MQPNRARNLPPLAPPEPAAPMRSLWLTAGLSPEFLLLGAAFLALIFG